MRGAGLLFVDSSQESTGTGYAKNAICFVFFDHDREKVNFRLAEREILVKKKSGFCILKEMGLTKMELGGGLYGKQ